MNERIKELAEQTFFDEATALPSDKMYTFSDHKMQKFAELIVRECCSIIEVDLETNKVKAETDNEGRIWANAQLTFSQLIKSRFDIKEN